MKTKLTATYVIVVMLFAFCFSCPLFVMASKHQGANVNNYIEVEVIDSVWLDSESNEVSKLSLPAIVSPGEPIDINGGLYVKNTGVRAYARVKVISKKDGEVFNAFDYQINSNWIKGNDGFFYYCSTEKNALIDENEIVKVIESVSISKNLNIKDKNSSISIFLTMEVIDAADDEYLVGWGQNPPPEWFDCIEE